MFSDQTQAGVELRKPPRPYSPVAAWAETFDYLFRHFGSILIAAIPALLVALVLGAALVNWMTGGQLISLLSGQGHDPSRVGVDPETDPAAFIGNIVAIFGVVLLSYSMFAVPITRHIFAGRNVTLISGLTFGTLRYMIMAVLVGVVVMVIIMLVSMVTFVPLMAITMGGMGEDGSNIAKMMGPMILIGLLMNVVFVLIAARFMFIPSASAVRGEENALSGWEVVSGNYWKVVIACLLVGATWLVLEIGIVSAAFAVAGKMSPFEVIVDILGANGDSGDFFNLSMAMSEGAFWPHYVQMVVGMFEFVVFVVFAAVSYRRLVESMPDG